MALIQKYESNYAIQTDDNPIPGVEYYTKAELRRLFREDPNHRTFDDEGKVISDYPDSYLGIDEIEVGGDDDDDDEDEDEK